MKSEEWRVESGQRRVSGAGKRLMTQLRFLKDLSETTLFHPRMICPAGQGPHLSETTLFHPRMICPAGQGPHLSETNEKKKKSYPRRATKNDEGPLRH